MHQNVDPCALEPIYKNFFSTFYDEKTVAQLPEVKWKYNNFPTIVKQIFLTPSPDWHTKTHTHTLLALILSANFLSLFYYYFNKCLIAGRYQHKYKTLKSDNFEYYQIKFIYDVMQCAYDVIIE